MKLSALYQLFLSCSVVTTDSRNCPANSMFIALKGDSFNGNLFATQALEKGCAYAVVDEATAVADDSGRYILVDDCLATLQALANYHRRELGTRVIGITGTNGKTTTKELIAAVLSQSYHVLYTQGNLNNHIGVPITLLRMTIEHDIAVIEMGANHPGEIKQLAEIAEPDCGIITNVGKAHLEGFGSFEGVVKTKGELYEYLRQKSNSIAFIHHENKYLQEIAHDLTLVEYGEAPHLFITGQVTDNSPYLAFNWQHGADGVNEVNTHLIGAYNFTNALAAVAIGRYFEVDDESINKALSGYEPQNNRSQLQKTAHNTLIIDAYNANPTSMMAALQNFQQMKAEHKMLILGDMRELGADSLAEHQRIVDLLKEAAFERVILIGNQFESVVSDFTTYPDVQAFITDLSNQKPKDYTILIKGSNGIKLNSVVEYL